MAHVPANQDPGGPQSGSLADALYKKLWSACVGLLVNVSHEGERDFVKGKKADPETEEVYADITLLPVQNVSLLMCHTSRHWIV
ncbi:auxin response factor 1-like [Rutidosis leptorrhynchoides]|uniref:auxin response factor 1-like n=1 Tax=Rutidosis leptorrhynchoides TaxID=125765 RepID=UPI003A99E1B3